MKKSIIKDIFNAFKWHRETMNMPKKDSKNADIICDSHEELEKN